MENCGFARVIQSSTWVHFIVQDYGQKCLVTGHGSNWSCEFCVVKRSCVCIYVINIPKLIRFNSKLHVWMSFLPEQEDDIIPDKFVHGSKNRERESLAVLWQPFFHVFDSVFLRASFHFIIHLKLLSENSPFRKFWRVNCFWEGLCSAAEYI